MSLETWKYEQNLTPELKLELFNSFSKSTLMEIQTKFSTFERLEPMSI